jgi:hypothetical protein
MIFDALVGPWIEQVGADRYRLSPLLRDSGEVGLAESQRTGIKAAVVEHLMARRPFPADQLLQVFILAYGLKLIPALSWFSGVLVHTATRDPETFKRLAEEVSVFAMADCGPSEPLVAGIPERHSCCGTPSSGSRLPTKMAGVPSQFSIGCYLTSNTFPARPNRTVWESRLQRL